MNKIKKEILYPGSTITADERSMIRQKMMMIEQHSIDLILLKGNISIDRIKKIPAGRSDLNLDSRVAACGWWCRTWVGLKSQIASWV